MTSPRFPSSLRFGSFLQYGIGEDRPEKRASKNIILSIKVDRVSTRPPRLVAELIVAALASALESTPLVEILSPRATLVPMPRSAPLLDHAVWGPRTICQQLVAHRLGRDWQRLIERVEAVDKSAYVKDPSNRPSPFRHYETMRALPSTVLPEELVLVDDVVTKGATFAGAVTRLMEVFPGVAVRAFAISRAVSDFHQIQDPIVGEIEIAPDGSKSRRNNYPTGRLF